VVTALHRVLIKSFKTPENALVWTGKMNNIRTCSREIVEKEITHA